MNPIEISRTGLDVEWQRLQIIAQNFANTNTTRTASGDPYRPMRLLSGPKVSFHGLVSGKDRPEGVQVLDVEPIAGGVRRVYEPSHPHADAEGFVTYPDIDQSAEMALLLKTSRAYEANLTAMSIAQQMYARALDIGKSG